MAHASYRADQEGGRYADHVRPIDERVDELSAASVASTRYAAWLEVGAVLREAP